MLSVDMALRLQQLGFERVTAMKWGDRLRVGDVDIAALPFHGEQPAEHEVLHPEVRNAGNTYVVRTPTLSCAFVADSGRDPSGDVKDVTARLGRARRIRRLRVQRVSGMGALPGPAALLVGQPIPVVRAALALGHPAAPDEQHRRCDRRRGRLGRSLPRAVRRRGSALVLGHRSRTRARRHRPRERHLRPLSGTCRRGGGAERPDALRNVHPISRRSAAPPAGRVADLCERRATRGAIRRPRVALRRRKSIATAAAQAGCGRIPLPPPRSDTSASGARAGDWSRGCGATPARRRRSC